MKTIISSSIAAFWLFVLTVAIGGNACSLTEATDKAPTGEKKEFSLVDLASHASPDDCWMAIEDGVYNVTEYIKAHPTPPEVVTAYCGKDATEAYRTKGGRGRPHSPGADAELKKYRMGEWAPQ